VIAVRLRPFVANQMLFIGVAPMLSADELEDQGGGRELAAILRYPI
jgi:hypothetical protein